MPASRPYIFGQQFIQQRKNLISKDDPEQKQYIGSDRGMCYGVAHEGMQAYLLDQMSAFSIRYEILAMIPPTELSKWIAGAHSRLKTWSIQAGEEARLQLDSTHSLQERLSTIVKTNYASEKDFNDAVTKEKTKYQHELNQDIQHRIEEKKKAYFKDKPEDHVYFTALLDMHAAAQTVEVHHQRRYYQQLFEEKKQLHNQDASRTLPLMMSHALEKQGGITKAANFSGMYSKSELTHYFSMLRNEIENKDPPIHSPIAMILDTSSHTICVGYDPRQKKWTLIDANQLPFKEIENSVTMDAMIADEVIAAFASTEQNTVTFTTNMYVKKTHERDFNMNHLFDQNEWKTLHNPTSLRAESKDAKGISWLHTAVLNGDANLVEDLLKSKANANQAKTNGVTPLYIAALHGHLDIAKSLLSHKAIANVTDANANTPLQCSALNGNLDMVKLLLEHTDPASYDAASQTAAAAGHADIAQWISEYKTSRSLPSEPDDFVVYIPEVTASEDPEEEVISDVKIPTAAEEPVKFQSSQTMIASLLNIKVSDELKNASEHVSTLTNDSSATSSGDKVSTRETVQTNETKNETAHLEKKTFSSR